MDQQSQYRTQLINYGSRLCMSPSGYRGSVAPGENIVQLACSRSQETDLHQWWNLNADGNYHEIQNVADSNNGIRQCLALPGGNAIIGWQLELYNCNGEPDQQWAFTPHGSSWVIWNKKSPNLVIAIWGGSILYGAAVELYYWEAHPDQSWIIPGSL